MRKKDEVWAARMEQARDCVQELETMSRRLAAAEKVVEAARVLKRHFVSGLRVPTEEMREALVAAVVVYDASPVAYFADRNCCQGYRTSTTHSGECRGPTDLNSVVEKEGE